MRKGDNASFGTHYLPQRTGVTHIDLQFTPKPDYYVKEIGSKTVINAVYDAPGKKSKRLTEQ